MSLLAPHFHAEIPFALGAVPFSFCGLLHFTGLWDRRFIASALVFTLHRVPKNGDILVDLGCDAIDAGCFC